MTHSHAHTMSADMQQCLDNCSACHDVCVRTAAHCLKEGGTHADAAHVTLLLDCAQICETSADAMRRGSAQSATICRACADICRACADSCDTLGHAECAAACRTCAESCTQMAAMKM